MIRTWCLSALIWAAGAAPALADYGAERFARRQEALPYIFGIVLALIPLALLWVVVLGKLRERKRRAAEALMDRLAAKDGAWDPRAFEARAREVFLAVAPVTTPEGLEAVRDMLTPEAAAAIATKIAKHQGRGVQRIFRLKELRALELLHVDDRRDREDRVWATIKFSGIDRVRAASLPPPEAGAGDVQLQLWKFRRTGDTWLLEGFEPTTPNAALWAPASTSE